MSTALPPVRSIDPSACPSCGSRVDRSPIEASCSGCGLVLDAFPIEQDQPATFDGDGSRVTRGGPLTRSPPSLDTFPTRTAIGRQLRFATRIAAERDPQRGESRRIAGIHTAIDQAAGLLELPQAVVEDARREVGQVRAAVVPGTSYLAIGAALTVIAARRSGRSPRVLDLSRALGIRSKLLFGVLHSLGRVSPPSRNELVRSLSAVQQARDACFALGLKAATTRQVIETVRRVETAPGGGSLPRVLAGGAIRYCTAGGRHRPSHPTIDEIAAALRCTEMSVRFTAKKVGLVLASPGVSGQASAEPSQQPGEPGSGGMGRGPARAGLVRRGRDRGLPEEVGPRLSGASRGPLRSPRLRGGDLTD